MSDQFLNLFAAVPEGEDVLSLLKNAAVRTLVLQTAGEIRSDWGYASDVLNRALRTHKGLSSRARRLVSESVYALVRFDRRLDAMIDEVLRAHRGPSRDLSPLARDRIKLAFLVAASGAGLDPAAAMLRADLGFVPPAAQVVGLDAGLGKRKGIDREAVRYSFPTWMLERLVDDHGLSEAIALAAALNQRAPFTVLVNTTRITRAALIDRLAQEGVEASPCRLAPTGVALHSRINVHGLASYDEGLFDVMDEGSQLVAEVVDARPGLRVVDACAGAGGKTLALDQAMAGTGRILSLDVSGKKLEETRRRVRRAGLVNVAARAVDATSGTLPDLAKPGVWDRVLVDAPCSAVGSMRRAPETRWRLTPTAVAAHANQQLGLLATYAPLVAAEGRLIYATCTLFEEENDRVVERFLADRRDFERVPLAAVVGQDRAEALGDGLSLRLLPHRHGTDGFFATILQRRR